MPIPPKDKKVDDKTKSVDKTVDTKKPTTLPTDKLPVDQKKVDPQPSKPSDTKKPVANDKKPTEPVKKDVPDTSKQPTDKKPVTPKKPVEKDPDAYKKPALKLIPKVKKEAEIIEIRPEQVHWVIKLQGTKISFARFRKKDGSIRAMYFQGAIARKFLRPNGYRAYNPAHHRLTWVRDIKLQSYDCIRSIKWDSLIEIIAGNKKFVLK